jgi:3-methylcrotonyl-CoA carboxylase alpha subunit
MTAVVSYAPAGAVATIDGVTPATDATAIDGDQTVYVIRHGRQTVVRLRDFASVDVEHRDGSGVVASPMHGKVLAVLVETGAGVTRGQRVALVEAMKMEHTLTAPSNGVVAEVAAKAGDQVAEGAFILRIEAVDAVRVVMTTRNTKPNTKPNTNATAKRRSGRSRGRRQ